MRRLTILLVLAALAALSAVVAADATTPSSGSISTAAPKMTWTGSTTSSAVAFNAFAQETGVPCAPPTCDAFSLDIKDGGSDVILTVELGTAANSGAATAGIRITNPAGETVFITGEAPPGKPLKHTLKAAAAGTYTLEHVDSFVCCGTIEFKATATYASAVATPTPSPGASATPTPTASATPTPQPAAPTLGIVSPSGFRRSAKSVAVQLRSSGRLTGVNVLLTKGKKTVAKGKLAKLDGKGKVTLKITRKLAKGTYGIAAGGKDAQGRNVTAGRKVKVS